MVHLSPDILMDNLIDILMDNLINTSNKWHTFFL